MTKELDNILEKFPTQRQRIMELYRASSNFRSLCEDYWISTQELSVHRKKLKSDVRLTKEYGTICLLLEKEVKDYIDKPFND